MCKQVGNENRKEGTAGPPLSDSTEAWRIRRVTLGRLLVTPETKALALNLTQGEEDTLKAPFYYGVGKGEA